MAFTPSFEIAYRKKIEEALKKQKKNEQFISISKILPNSNTANGASEITFRNANAMEENFYHESASSSSGMRHRLASVPKERIASTGAVMPQFIVLDMSICPFIDNDGVLLVKALLSSLSDLNIRLLLARCSGK